MYKLSRYLVTEKFSDLKDGLDKVILFGTRNSIMNVLDKTSFSYILEKKFSLLEPHIFQALKEANIIVEENENELQTILEENKKFIQDAKELYFVLQPSAFCPLGCHYCGQLHSPKGMSEEVQKQTIARITQKLSERKYDGLRICWFGAEPLSGLSVIRPLSHHLQDVARTFDIEYSAKIVTNGWRLTLPIAQDLVKDHKVNHIEITLDGIAEFHDSRRHTKTGQETFHVIYNNLLNMCNAEDLNVYLSIRCNVDERNKEGISPLIKKLAKDNLQKKVSLYFAQIHSWGNDAHKLAADKRNFARWEIAWFLEMASYGFRANYLHPRKKQACMALSPNSELIDPHGGVFRCTEVSLVPSYEQEGVNIHQLGSLSTPSQDLKQSAFSNFYEEDEIKKFSCHKCEILPICGGSCPKEWKEGRVPCPPIKFNIKERLILSYAKHFAKQNYDEFLTHMSH